MINQMRERDSRDGWRYVSLSVLLGEGGSSSTLVVIATIKVERYFNIGVGLFVSWSHVACRWGMGALPVLLYWDLSRCCQFQQNGCWSATNESPVNASRQCSIILNGCIGISLPSEHRDIYSRGLVYMRISELKACWNISLYALYIHPKAYKSSNCQCARVCVGARVCSCSWNRRNVEAYQP